jgi:hypothetical protein
MLGHSHASVWRTKDGREIHISDMIDAHLLNTITYLQKLAPMPQVWPQYPTLIAEAKKRKLIAGQTT